MSSSPAELELAPPVDRDALIAAGHHPLAFCEWCQQPTAGPLADCDQPECVHRAIAVDMHFVRLDDGMDDQ